MFLPSLRDYNYKRKTGTLISQTINEIGDKDYEKEWNEAVKYNKELMQPVSSTDINDKTSSEKYSNMLNVNGIMGYITIPKINTQLPIYHGTSANVLQKGVGHLPTSSLPTGGKGNHTVITGHTGIEVGKMFDDLTKLSMGDKFYLNICGKELCYKVDNITTVLPNETNLLLRKQDKDYCTLVTCTPYGINSHRLLVRGERVQNPNPENSQSVLYPDNKMIIYYISSVLLIFVIFVIVAMLGKKKEG